MLNTALTVISDILVGGANRYRNIEIGGRFVTVKFKFDTTVTKLMYGCNLALAQSKFCHHSNGSSFIRRLFPGAGLHAHWNCSGRAPMHSGVTHCDFAHSCTRVSCQPKT